MVSARMKHYLDALEGGASNAAIPRDLVKTTTEKVNVVRVAVYLSEDVPSAWHHLTWGCIEIDRWKLAVLTECVEWRQSMISASLE